MAHGVYLSLSFQLLDTTVPLYHNREVAVTLRHDNLHYEAVASEQITLRDVTSDGLLLPFY